jgi:hypothetical protein
MKEEGASQSSEPYFFYINRSRKAINEQLNARRTLIELKSLKRLSTNILKLLKSKYISKYSWFSPL